MLESEVRELKNPINKITERIHKKFVAWSYNGILLSNKK